MNKVIQNKALKFFKLFITSALLEIITTLIYIISFIVLCVEYTNIGNNNYTNHQLHDIIHNYFSVSQFNTISNIDDFITYFDTLVHKLYTFNSSTPIPFVIPIDALRLAKYAESSCNDDSACVNDYMCTVTALKALYGYSRCGKPYKGPTTDHNSTEVHFKMLISRLQGEYTSYDLLDDGVQMDVTVDEWTTMMNTYVDMLRDKNMKCILIMCNVYIPANKNYAHVVLGIEMLNYFTNVSPLFTVTIYTLLTSDNTVFFIFFIFFSICSLINLIKFLYESNNQCICSIHAFMFYNESLNILLIIFTAFLMNVSEHTRTTITTSAPTTHHSHLALICIRKWIYIILAMTIICLPFRFISLLSWCKPLSKHIVRMIRIMLRMLPGLLICSFIISLIFLMFILTNYALYNEVLDEYKDIYSSFISMFSPRTLHILLNKSKVYHSLSHSSYYVVFNLYQTMIVMLLFGLLTGTMSYLFRRANSAEAENSSDDDDDNDDNTTNTNTNKICDEGDAEVLEKIKQIEEKVIRSRNGNDIKAGDVLQKQTVWLNLSSSNDIYTMFADKGDLILFKTTRQVLLFLRYYFGIQPELRFNGITDKLSVIVEINNEYDYLKEFELEQIELLVDWVMFVGCRVPIMVYTHVNVNNEVKMKMQSMYELISFIEEVNKIETFIRSEPPAYVCCVNDSFRYECVNGEIVFNSSFINNNNRTNMKVNSRRKAIVNSLNNNVNASATANASTSAFFGLNVNATDNININNNNTNSNSLI